MKEGLNPFKRSVPPVQPSQPGVKEYFYDDKHLPLVMEASQRDTDLAYFIQQHAKRIEAILADTGAILFTGFPVGSLERFNEIVAAMGRDTLRYDFGSTPRTLLANGIYTSTEYPAEQEIPMHNEMSYTSNWPGRVWFYCEQPADTGGETPIADSRKVYEQLPFEIKNSFEAHGIKYVRNYHDGVDVPWQQVFQTTDPAQVTAYCAQHGITADWSKGHLQTYQVCQASMPYNSEGNRVWFNQAHLFHYAALPVQLREHLLELFDEKDLPRNSYLGNGEPIPVSAVEAVQEVYNQIKVAYKMKQDDILLLNNIITAHGRHPFTGNRKVRVAMTR